MSKDHSLSKLALVLYPTNSISIQKLLLLYSSVVGEDVWHLSLIGPSVPECNMGQQETWWEGKWIMQDLQRLAPSQSLVVLVCNVRQSFSEDDIALRGYREGNENKLGLTIRYSIPGVAFDVPLMRLNSNNMDQPSQLFIQRPFLNLLEIICEAHQNIKRQGETTKRVQANNFGSNATTSSSSNHQRTQNTTETNPCKIILTSSIDLLSKNLANPRKKVRTLVVDGFISSGDS